MAAYIIADEEVMNPDGMAEYGKLAGPTLQKYGGRAIVAVNQTEALEGDWQPKRLVILEFESMERAKEWYESPEYKAAMVLRHRAAKTNMIIVEGR